MTQVPEEQQGKALFITLFSFCDCLQRMAFYLKKNGPQQALH